MSMPPAVSRSGVFASLRSRVVAISVIPSLIFICAVVGVGWYQSDAALRDRSTAALVGQGIDATAAFSTSVMEERRISVQGNGDVTSARGKTDAAVAGVRSFMGGLPDSIPSTLRASLAGLGTAADAVSLARRGVDAGARDQDAYAAYEPVVEPLIAVIGPQVAPGSDHDVVTAMGAAGSLLAVVESIRSADLVVATDGPSGLDVRAYRELTSEIGQVGEAMQRAVAALPAARRDAGTALLDSPDWRTFTADTDLLLAAGPRTNTPIPSGQSSSDTQRSADRVPVDRTAAVVGELTAAGDAVAGRAADIAFGTAHDAVALAADRAGTTLNLIVGVVLSVVAFVVAAMLFAMRTGNRLGRRMAVLQSTTHGTSERLPSVLERIRRGEPVDVDAEFPVLDHGTDEIGEVGAAVDAAQRTAVAAAVEEARTRAGANAVFLNIAHRSQAIVHRQLQVLDEAERAENDSDQLARLFQLDHLSTRERRNAENLIIMGGQEPRRRWRKPVPLAEIIRSAVSESEQYTRITLGETPFRHIDGAAVGDLIHLLAELVDNATSFSPPQCPIDISASVVGRGVAVEIEDRGLGIEPEPRNRLNEMLADPPDFGLLTLSEDSRLGMFVVSRLAQRHGVRVTLLESTYGGVQALVLVPNTLLVAPPDDEEPVTEPEPVRGAGTPFGRGTNGRRSNGSHPDGPSSNGHYTEPDGLPRGSAAPPQSRLARPPADAPPRSARPALPERTSRPGAAPALPERISRPDATPAVGRIAEVPAADVAPAPPSVAPASEATQDPASAAPVVSAGTAPVVDTAAASTAASATSASATSASATSASATSATAPSVARMPAVRKPHAPVAKPTTADVRADVRAPVPPAAAEVVAPVAAPTDDVPPPLPERRPQGHLARGLRGQPATGQVAADSESPEPAAGRSSSAMSAMQRGVRSSRKDAAEDGSAK